MLDNLSAALQQNQAILERLFPLKDPATLAELPRKELVELILGTTLTCPNHESVLSTSTLP